MKRNEAFTLAMQYGFPINEDFHRLTTDQVAGVIAAADFRRYRAPKNANGSRARYFHAYLRRVSERNS